LFLSREVLMRFWAKMSREQIAESREQGAERAEKSTVEILLRSREVLIRSCAEMDRQGIPSRLYRASHLRGRGEVRVGEGKRGSLNQVRGVMLAQVRE
jgi:hypothetical protein